MGPNDNNVMEDDPSLPDLPNNLIVTDDILDLIIDIIDQEMPPTAQERPHVVITEQPQSKALRFRYECEGRSAGSIPGVHSTPEQKTFPGIEIRGYKGRAVVVVSCVTKDPPYRPHPHNLVGKEGCKKGVCTVEINSSTMSYTFSNLGIQCVKKKDIEEALRLREEIRVDPFKTGYGHARQPATIDLNAIRLCFQVFLEGQQRGRFTEPLQPVVSDVIYDKKAMSDLVICKLSDVTAPVAGGREIILLCEKVAKEDIAVRFYEEQHGNIVWEEYGEFQHTNVHKQVAICFRTPRYRTLEVEHPVMVNIQLKRPSDGATSEPLPFELTPLDSAKRKKRKPNTWGDTPEHMPEAARHPYYATLGNVPGEAIKTEPRDSPTHPFNFIGNYRQPNESPSPIERSPLYGNTTPVGQTSPYNAGRTSVTPTPGGYQPNVMNADFLLGGTQQFQNQYAFPTLPPTNGQPMYLQQPQQQQQQQQFQPPANMNNQQQFNVSNLIDPQDQLPQPGPSGVQAVPSFQPSGSIGEINISSPWLTMDSSELKSLMVHTLSDMKQEQQRIQQEAETLSDSFDRLSTNLNNLNKP
ncbi:embryonic polarity protein dorsal isoform X4 [Aedes aegypti]|uniref:RHD domain-containing protein n=1 Tax=Aedes aegypti TaxID=7159 RepID=A0A1S4FHE4_AEDAE|nr:embryonic polarity protein dorsal isoform X4 [Aedes aegypti]XP_021704028.1 embryonic polarity protein dorsal isoform X4 [Aedes aegypti]XP_021704029.1 embryonic polarity protein dorsal isoform X4 [Aedes aegypti]